MPSQYSIIPNVMVWTLAGQLSLVINVQFSWYENFWRHSQPSFRKWIHDVPRAVSPSTVPNDRHSAANPYHPMLSIPSFHQLEYDRYSFAPQILVMGPGDYLDNGGSSRCEQMVERAAKLKQSRINFTPSLFWVDENGSSRKTVNAAVSNTDF